MTGDGLLEIERKWILRALPPRVVAFESGDVDSAIERIRLRQGYLRPATEAEIDALAIDSEAAGPIRFGRIRSIESADGIRHVHTVKSGHGLVRREVERPIDVEVFERAWPETVGRRIVKTRWLVREEGPAGETALWEIDHFDAIDLVLAEIEAPDEAAAGRIRIPQWLAPAIDREVTHDPAFTNAEIALRMIADGA